MNVSPAAWLRAADFERQTGEAARPEEIVARASAGDAAARRVLEAWTSRLARGLASVVNLLDPDVIVMGGGLSAITSLYDDVPRLWRRWVFSDRVATRLVPAMYGATSGVRGAAWLWEASQQGGGRRSKVLASPVGSGSPFKSQRSHPAKRCGFDSSS